MAESTTFDNCSRSIAAYCLLVAGVAARAASCSATAYRVAALELLPHLRGQRVARARARDNLEVAEHVLVRDGRYRAVVRGG